MITLPPLAAPVDELWHLLLDLAELPVAWTLVGGQMVLLHALEHGRVPLQVSQDGDVIADVRADQNALRAVVAALMDQGFDLISRPLLRAARSRSRPGSRPCTAPNA